MSDSASRELEALIDDFHSRERIRVWSLVITIFGDAVIPRGGELWLGSLLELMERLRIEPSALRAAMSRLTADGWLTRLRIGRKSFYRLAEAGEAEFAEAARRIYRPHRSDWSGKWLVLSLSTETGEGRDARRRQLRSAGFGALSPTVFLRPETVENATTPELQNGEVLFHSTLDHASEVRHMVAQAWRLDDVEKLYRRFIDTFTPLERALGKGALLEPLSAMAARSLLIHHFRPIALRDPAFPAELTPENSLGDEARMLVARIYRKLADASETWLDACPDSNDEPIRKPEIEIAERFAK
ncbi:phenylacetic acid degradation operon negative regulatory protein PaaX [Nitratireductor sp. XY-223]|uniref:phenylacetic acid degradation operon negative regulatory protein PaaX n=1 Tax=Nitratireductor sp. XY-223 TaxID=2561926 RepID=UPI0010AAD4BC|nr:phenylacetic acid degradation operon negative regulatory protein PaaX [Nitratireductor sp. XY-223]